MHICTETITARSTHSNLLLFAANMKMGKSVSTYGVQYRQIDAAQAGQRLDNFLISNLKGVPKSHIYRILRKGEVRINRGRCGADYRLRAGDMIRIPPLRIAERGPDRARVVSDSLLSEALILYEDDELIVVNKPAGCAVHGGSGVRLGLIEALRDLRHSAGFLELVHRLDRETSGCLLVAKQRPVLLALHEQLREAKVNKRYTALVRGRWDEAIRYVDLPLEKYRVRSGERMVEVSQGGKDAATRFIPKKLFENSTQVEIKLLTGRTHQARVHAAHIGHPIAGDKKYGDRQFNRQMRYLGLRRLFLHASAVGFKHPQSGSRMVVKALLPPELQTFLQCLESVITT